MITIRLLGGAKKSFSADSLQADMDGTTVQEMLEWLLAAIPEGAPRLDTDNILVAINGADSSTAGGRGAVLRSGDTVSIIPVIHGGAAHVRCVVGGRTVGVFGIRKGGAAGVILLEELREKFPRLTLQAVSKKYILGVSHVQKILQISVAAQRRGTMLSKRLETDILMRFAGTAQISRAIERAGIGGGGGFFLIALGGPASMAKLRALIKPHPDGLTFAQPNSTYLTGKFGMTKIQMRAVDSASPLEDLLVERAAVLF